MLQDKRPLPLSAPHLAQQLQCTSHACPIVPNFPVWSFPERIPPHFRAAVDEPTYTPLGSLPAASAVSQRDIYCRLPATWMPLSAHTLFRSVKEHVLVTDCSNMSPPTPKPAYFCVLPSLLGTSRDYGFRIYASRFILGLI